MNRRWIFIIWVITMVMAFAVGYSVAPTSVPGPASMSASKPDAVKGDLRSRQPVAALALPSMEQGTRASVSQEQIQTRLFDVLYHPNQLERQRRLVGLLDEISAENWQSVIAAFVSQTAHTGRRHDREWAIALERVGEVAGSAAVEWFFRDPKGGGSFNAGTCLQAWAASNPQAAIAWFQTAPGDIPKEQVSGWLVHGLAQSSLDVARTFVESFPPERRAAFADELVAGAIQQGGIQGAQAFMDQIAQSPNADPSFTHRVFDQISGELLRAHWLAGTSEQACSWIEQHLDKPYMTASVVRHAAHDYAIQDPQAALEWVRSAVNEKKPAFVEAAVSGVVERWENQTQLVNWLQSNSDHALHDQVAHHYARRVGEMDPAAAAKWIGTIQDENIRRQAQQELAQRQVTIRLQ